MKRYFSILAFVALLANQAGALDISSSVSTIPKATSFNYTVNGPQDWWVFTKNSLPFEEMRSDFHNGNFLNNFSSVPEITEFANHSWVISTWTNGTTETAVSSRGEGISKGWVPTTVVQIFFDLNIIEKGSYIIKIVGGDQRGDSGVKYALNGGAWSGFLSLETANNYGTGTTWIHTVVITNVTSDAICNIQASITSSGSGYGVFGGVALWATEPIVGTLIMIE